ncbi:ADP-ribosylglycohydrolase family protein OS=Streptomyces alboniger OX=132473 GN=CP975_07315 PE=4 SV=1 [Streptomyces alboniger]
MRVAPVGLVPGLSDEQRAGAAQLQAALTHGHPTALAASDLTAHAVRLLAQGPAGRAGRAAAVVRGRNRSHYHERWLERPVDAQPRPLAREWRRVVGVLDRLQEALRAPSPETDPCLATGAGWIAEEALATGLLSFLLFVDEPLTALRRAACTSGDSDSIACLAGAFAGAHLGAEVWPGQWADRIEYQSELASSAPDGRRGSSHRRIESPCTVIFFSGSGRVAGSWATDRP